jgi:hypothetical protein
MFEKKSGDAADGVPGVIVPGGNGFENNEINELTQTGLAACGVLGPDHVMLGRFMALLRHAGEDVWISHRVYTDTKTNKAAVHLRAVQVRAGGAALQVAPAVHAAELAARHSAPAVYCLPLAGFSNGDHARTDDLVEAYTHTVDCDDHPVAAREHLERHLGPATLIVESGGVWIDPETGEAQAKVHLHWRLKTPASGAALQQLKEARRLAVEAVGGDPTGVALVHCFRVAGSLHRKNPNAPRLARIASDNPEVEVDLTEVLARAGSMPKGAWIVEKRAPSDRHPREEAPRASVPVRALGGADGASRPDDVRRALFEYWDPDSYADWSRAALALHSEPYGEELWHEWSARSPKYDEAEACRKWRQTEPDRGITVRTILARVPRDELSRWGREHREEKIMSLGLFRAQRTASAPEPPQHRSRRSWPRRKLWTPRTATRSTRSLPRPTP